ncbi:MAG: glutamate-1-semialdehyde 2,1-aminomutase [Planctomycetota bacterium]|nr:glutamate-1-semialdehyde 2,1-aminomutase [Planctomycetota bacterium]MCX8039327.1 glutamate-1-semialdehyde 2,1-aminomutase [Planctomycetota bacterium]MDW8372093.1 glutamate-1-semialdehyde 2,1-aminomutase [Planctomycetota bacterium]
MSDATSLAGPRSRRAFAAACQWIPGGVNSPVRAWKRLGGQPLVIAAGRGSRLHDLDGRAYIDYVLSWGPLILGHAHPRVVRALSAAAERGVSFGAPTEAETRLASVLCQALPSMEQVRLVNSGTEACMSALRLARAATGRRLVIKFDGCYHGHADAFLVAAGSGCATLATPDSAGVPPEIAAYTISCPYNDAAAVEAVLARYRREVAAVIVEPVAGNMGLVLPRRGFLEGLRAACTAHGALLIFDEVMTGFRVGWGGWQQLCGVRPDLTCLGKVIGGGLPLAAYGGRRDVMAHLAPLGPCYQAGTLSGNPLAVAAGLATLAVCARAGFYQRLTARLARLLAGLQAAAATTGIALQLAQAGTMWGYFFADAPVTDWASAQRQHEARWRVFVSEMYRRGVYLAPSPYEAAFFSLAHSLADVRATCRAAAEALAAARAV